VTLRLSCAFATSLQTHEHTRIAEQLGYERALFYDSPAIYPDVWVQLCRAAERTERIGLGPGVLVPSLRHPMTTASAISTLVSIAGAERVVVAVGTGFTGRFALGQRALPWAYVERYVRTVKALLRGDQVEWEDGLLQMMHSAAGAPQRPINVPFIISAVGPKGTAIAQEIGDGVMGIIEPNPALNRSLVLAIGTVLQDGEHPGSERVIAAAGPACGMMFHGSVEMGADFPNAEKWRAAYEDVPENARHLALHAGHLTEVNDHDRPFISGDLLVGMGLARSAGQWRDRLAELEAGGASEVVYQPAGDIPRELEAFAEAARG
jgi:5,10-methylenetetrahydromethanopterin reductase